MALPLSGMYRTLYALGVLTVLLLWTFWRAGVESTTSLSPQGCGMSYMSPNYLPQTAFDASWTPLARRYSLLLYREAGGWQEDTPNGLPVLFIPGNAGSAHQIRSVASSAARTYYEKPGTVAKGMTNIRPLDFFALEHNEDLSALHGPTLETEAAYANRALDYIASLYPKDTPIILMGHSMGGVVAASLLAPNATNATISALVTLSAPHTLPPARLDRRIAKFYDVARTGLEHSPVPIVSICGGATDGMVHSEACVLPPPASDNADAHRHTVFASALEGAWTGMGHQVSVWCDQVRRLVARALLNTAPLATPADRAVALSAAFPDGFTRAAATYKAGKTLNFQRNKKSKDFYPPTLQLALGSFAWNGIFMMPAPFQPGSLFTMYIGGGNAQGVGPEEKNTKLTGSVHACRQVSGDKPQGHECWPVTAKRIRRIPYVHANVSFPRLEGQAAFEEQEDEEEGKKVEKIEGRKGEAGVRTGKDGWKDEITVWEADVPMPEDDAPLWIAVETDGSDGKGWLVAGSSEAYDAHISYSYGVHDLLHSPALIRLDPASMRTEVTLPRLTPSPLLVYRATPLWDNYTLCATARIPPTLEHTSPSASEAHWHPLLHADPHSPAYRPILLHSHAGAPFFELPAASVKNNESAIEGTQFTIYSTGSHAEGKCQLKGLSLSLDWRASTGRAATRYWPALPAWALGVALWVFGMHWAASSSSALASTLPGAPLPTPKQTLHRFVTRHLLVLMFVAYIAAHFSLSPEYLLGNSGRSALAPLAPLMLFLATGTTIVVYTLLQVILYLPTLFYRAKLRTSGVEGEKERDEDESIDIGKRGAAIVAIIVAVGTIVPWQAAFAGAWVWHLFTTARSAAYLAARGGADNTPPEYERLSLSERDDISLDHPHHAPVSAARQAQNALAEHKHLLLLLTLVLPFAGPGLAVWKHIGVSGTIAGAGEAFRGDHAIWSVSPFVVAVEWAGRRRRGGVFEPTRIRVPGPVPLTSAHAFSLAALVACARGAYAGYAAPEAAAGAIAIGLACRVGARWWRDTRARRVGLGEKPV